MHYKGYTGSVEFSDADGVFYDKVQGIRSLVSYEGRTCKELEIDFHKAADDYLALCEGEQEKERQENIRPAVENMLKAARTAADDVGEYSTCREHRVLR